jgi:hypothetical protein
MSLCAKGALKVGSPGLPHSDLQSGESLAEDLYSTFLSLPLIG